jgi:hypothetical protein
VVDSSLHKKSAEDIFSALLEAGRPTELELEEAVERADGLLMEFITLATSGQRLREVLKTQLHPLRTTERSLDRHVLRMVCGAHTLGNSIDASHLAAALSPADPAIVGDSLLRLEGEHLVIQDLVVGMWRGIHDLRAEIIQEILHEAPPPVDGTSWGLWVRAGHERWEIVRRSWSVFNRNTHELIRLLSHPENNLGASLQLAPAIHENPE